MRRSQHRAPRRSRSPLLAAVLAVLLGVGLVAGTQAVAAGSSPQSAAIASARADLSAAASWLSVAAAAPTPTVTVTATVTVTPVAPTPTPTPTPTATSSPGSTPRMFGASSLWNTPKTGLSFTDAATPALSSATFGNNNGAYDVPTYFAASTDPVTTFKLGAGWGFPATTITTPAPAGMHPASGGDAVMDVLLGDGRLLDMYGVSGSATSWTATYYGVSDGVNGPGFGAQPYAAAGTTAIGSPQAGGVILARDITAGVIGHGLRMSLPWALLGGAGDGAGDQVPPAVANDDGGGPGPVPEGALLLIPAGTPTPAGLSVMGRALWTAAQTYGVYIVDQVGGSVAEFSGDGSAAVDNAFKSSDFTAVGQALRLAETW